MTDFKAQGKLDAAKRVTCLYLYAHHLEEREEVSRSDVNHIVRELGLYDANYRNWLSSDPGIAQADGRLRLRALGRDSAITYLNEVLDPSVEGKYLPGQPPRRRTKRGSAAADEAAPSSTRQSRTVSKKVTAWLPELNGGRLCEAVARALHQLDSGRVTHKLLPGTIREKLLDDQRPHALPSSDRHHIAKALDLVYKFRSQRGAVHITPDYTANDMDSLLILHVGKWLIAELLRIALNQDRETVARTISQLVQLEHAIIHEFDGKPLVLIRDVSAPEEILLLLFNAAGKRLTRVQLREYAMQRPGTVNAAISRLIGERVIRAAGDEVILTPSGEKRVLQAILPKHRVAA